MIMLCHSFDALKSASDHANRVLSNSNASYETEGAVTWSAYCCLIIGIIYGAKY